MKIEVSEIKKCMMLICEFLNSNNIEEINVNSDYYINIENDIKFNIENYEKILNKDDLDNFVDIGSLYDDIIMTRKTIGGDSAVSTVTIDRMAHILEYISFYILTDSHR